jgi:hypothetical protein
MVHIPTPYNYGRQRCADVVVMNSSRSHHDFSLPTLDLEGLAIDTGRPIAHAPL